MLYLLILWLILLTIRVLRKPWTSWYEIEFHKWQIQIWRCNTISGRGVFKIGFGKEWKC